MIRPVRGARVPEIVMAIPGGWHGSDPGYLDSDPRRGVVTVDVTRIVDAIEWLKRRATILETRVSRTTGHWGGSDPGIVIVYRLRGRSHDQHACGSAP